MRPANGFQFLLSEPKERLIVAVTLREFPPQQPMGPVVPVSNVSDLSSVSVTTHKQTFDVLFGTIRHSPSY